MLVRRDRSLHSQPGADLAVSRQRREQQGLKLPRISSLFGKFFFHSSTTIPEAWHLTPIPIDPGPIEGATIAQRSR